MTDERRQFTGRSAAEAAIKACDALGVTRSELKYDVVSEVGDGLDRSVTIVVVEVVDPPPPRRTDGAGGYERGWDVDREAGGSGPGGGGGGRGGRSDRSSRGRGGRGERSDRRGGRGRDRDRGRDGERRSRRGTGGGPRFDSSQDGVDALLDLNAAAAQAREARPALEGELSPKAIRAREVVGEIVSRMEVAIEPRVVEDGVDEIHVDLVGGDEERVIGKTGDVLLSLQFLVNRIVGRDVDGDQVVVLDAGGYRGRRRGALEELARRLAARALEENKAVRLSAMSAHDRRVFHLTLKNYDGVSTRSEGEGLYRRMLIIPSEVG